MPDYGRGKRPLDQPTRPEASMRRDRDRAQSALDRFTNVKIRALVERGDRVVKGSREGEHVGASKGAISRPTESVALVGLPDDDESPDVWREMADEVGKCLREIAGLLDLAGDTMEAAEDKLQYVLNLSANEFALSGQHKTAGTCRACARTVTGSADDRLRSGYCDACRKAWERVQARWTDESRPGAPDRVAFEKRRLAEADAERRRIAS